MCLLLALVGLLAWVLIPSARGRITGEAVFDRADPDYGIHCKEVSFDSDSTTVILDPIDNSAFGRGTVPSKFQPYTVDKSHIYLSVDGAENRAVIGYLVRHTAKQHIIITFSAVEPEFRTHTIILHFLDLPNLTIQTPPSLGDVLLSWFGRFALIVSIAAFLGVIIYLRDHPEVRFAVIGIFRGELNNIGQALGFEHQQNILEAHRRQQTLEWELKHAQTEEQIHKHKPQSAASRPTADETRAQKLAEAKKLEAERDKVAVTISDSDFRDAYVNSMNAKIQKIYDSI